MDFNTINHNYKHHLWSKIQVKIAVKKGVITAEQYKEITGENYGE